MTAFAYAWKYNSIGVECAAGGPGKFYPWLQLGGTVIHVPWATLATVDFV